MQVNRQTCVRISQAEVEAWVKEQALMQAGPTLYGATVEIRTEHVWDEEILDYRTVYVVVIDEQDNGELLQL